MFYAIKQIANMYLCKCNKYNKDELTPDMRDILFKEAFDEYYTMDDINSVLNQKHDMPLKRSKRCLEREKYYRQYFSL